MADYVIDTSGTKENTLEQVRDRLRFAAEFISMRLRVLFITALLVGGFLFITSRTDWGRRRILQPISSAAGRFGPVRASRVAPA